MRKLLIPVILFFILTKSSRAQTGELDPVFGDQGIISTDMGLPDNYRSFGKQVLLKQDGSIYLVTEEAGVTVIAKKLANGSADVTYGNNGFSVPVPIYGNKAESNVLGSGAANAALQPDGKIIIVGYTRNAEEYDNYTDFAIARLNQDGSLDKTFDEDGIQVSNFGYDNIATSVAVQSDGKVVVAGYSHDDYSGGPYLFTVARYNSDGSPDISFSEDGWVQTDLITNVDYYDDLEIANAITIQNDGNIIVAGNVFNGDNYDFALVRYKPDGSLDSSFSGDGKQTTDFGFSYDLANAIAIQSDGKIVVGGYKSLPGNTYFIIARYNINGSLDHTFSGDGKQTTDFNRLYNEATSLAIAANGRIVLAGYCGNMGLKNFAIACFNASGELDNTFHEDGKLTTDFRSSDDYANSVAIQTDGKLVALGYSVRGDTSSVAASRYNTNGTIDDTFVGDGKLIGQIRQGNTVFTCTVVQSDGKVLAAGKTWNGSNWDFALVRYNIDGTYDNSFSADGRQITDFGASDDYVSSILIQPDKKIIVAGSSGDNFALARYSTNGSLDNTFSNDGLQISDFGSYDYIAAIAIQTDGKIVACGSTLARFNTNGSPDINFRANLPEYGLSSNYLAIQNDGKIVSGNARYNTNGTIDKSFGDNGTLQFQDEDFIGNSIAIQSDGKIVIGGYINSFRVLFSPFVVIRINTDGRPDLTFDGDGIAYVEMYDHDYPTSVKIQDDNKIVLAGYSYNGSSDDFTIVRFNKNGSLDNTFSEDGIQITQVSGAYDRINSIAIAGNKLYAAGFGQFPGTYGVITRYLLDDKINIAPVVSITSPSNNAVYTAPANIPVKAAASDEDGVINSVRFYNGGTLLETDNASPYNLTVTGLAAGNYSLVAKATDNNGTITSSETVAISVSGSSNKAPAVHITAPVINGVYSAPAVVNVNATASDEDGTISNVKFYSGTELLKTDSIAPYTCTLSELAAGTYTLMAKATDNKGVSASSSSVVITVRTNKAPAVKITSPANNTDYNTPASIVINVSASDADGIVKNVMFYNNGTFVKTDSIKPYSCTLTGMGKGDYVLTAKATDNNGLTSSSASVAVSVSGIPNKSPVVKITTPANNAVYTAPAFITIKATPTDEDGIITSVRFYNGGTLLATDSTSPYSYKLTNVAAGHYSFVAKATDNKGMTGSAASVAVSVSVLANKAPVISITSPANNSVYTAPVTMDIEASAVDADGTISNVKFYNGGRLLATDDTSPYIYTLTDAAAGNLSIIAKATDNKGLSSSSASITIAGIALPNQAPIINIIDPDDNTVYNAPAAINIHAAASDADGAISHVKFYNGGTLLGVDSTNPYTYAITNFPPGSYAITAKATDNEGLSNTSESISIAVGINKTPAVRIISPANNAIYTAPARITINASASDSGGTIRSVKFYNGTTWLKTDYSSPYSYYLANLSEGDYCLTARVTDNNGSTVNSAAVIISVIAPKKAPAVSTRPGNIESFTGAGSKGIIPGLNDAVSLQLAPNPATNKLSISATGLQKNKQAALSVISASGVLIKARQINKLTQTIQLDVSSLVTGIYTIKLISGDKVMYKKFVKL